MLGQQFYHESIRKIVVSFGTIFNDIHLVRKDNDGDITQTMKVPLAYGPRQKFLVRLQDDPDLGKQVAVTLPRIGFEITGLNYDASRKLNRVQQFKKVKGNTTKQLDAQYMPVPYNINFGLYILSKQSDDALQIVEQILPYFQPDYTITMNDMPDMGIKRDVPIVLTNVGYEDNYQGDFTARRSIIYSLDFTAKFYLYGPVTSSKVIKTAQADQYADMPDKSPKREQRYAVTPSPTAASADDDFGFNETTSFFEDAKNYNPVTGADE
jgi:hypothetical protein|tara:strand:- start:1171 stop:1971 length:801 start_codon:yes stop_codon:yes gene_type:complete